VTTFLFSFLRIISITNKYNRFWSVFLNDCDI